MLKTFQRCEDDESTGVDITSRLIPKVCLLEGSQPVIYSASLQEIHAAESIRLAVRTLTMIMKGTGVPTDFQERVALLIANISQVDRYALCPLSTILEFVFALWDGGKVIPDLDDSSLVRIKGPESNEEANSVNELLAGDGILGTSEEGEEGKSHLDEGDK